jgi:hypothetical protein
MKSSMTTTSTVPPSITPTPGATFPLVIRTRATFTLVNRTPTKERPLFAEGTKTNPSESP